MPLTDITIRKAKAKTSAYKLSDGGGMFLLVTPKGGKWWRISYRHEGKQKTISLGTFPEVSLGMARQLREDARKVIASGVDPSALRKVSERAKQVAEEQSFEFIADEWIAMKSKIWVESTTQKTQTHFREYVFPELGHRAIAELNAPDFLMMLRKVESRRPYTAIRLREMCSQICRYAVATGRTIRNPVADLAGALQRPPVTHRPAITDRREFSKFLRDFSAASMNPITRAAARFAMLTMVRAQEFRYAKWEEIDWQAAEWRVPPKRMKTGKHLQAHIVPLAKQSLALLRDLQILTGYTPYLFPSANRGDGVISENTVGKALNDLGYQGRQCAHGFRATARSLLSEESWSEGALERQLDHKEKDGVKAAYARSEHLDERRRMMQSWADMLDAMEAGAPVVSLRRYAA